MLIGFCKGCVGCEGRAPGISGSVLVMVGILTMLIIIVFCCSSCDVYCRCYCYLPGRIGVQGRRDWGSGVKV